MHNKNKFYGIVFVIIAAACFGILPIISLYAYKGGINVITLMSLRFSLAAIIFFIYVVIRQGKPKINKSLLFRLFLLGGVCYAIQASLYLSSVNYIPVSIASLIFYTYPVFVAVLSLVVLKERINWYTSISIALSLLGLALLFKNIIGNIVLTGVLLAFGAALVQSCYNVMVGRILKELDSMTASAFISLFASISLWTAGLCMNKINLNFKKEVWIYIACIVVFSTCIAIFALLKGIQIIGTVKASVLSMIEPVFTVVFSLVLLNETLLPVQIAGGIIVVSGTVLAVTARRHCDDSRGNEDSSGIKMSKTEV